MTSKEKQTGRVEGITSDIAQAVTQSVKIGNPDSLTLGVLLESFNTELERPSSELLVKAFDIPGQEAAEAVFAAGRKLAIEANKPRMIDSV